MKHLIKTSLFLVLSTLLIQVIPAQANWDPETCWVDDEDLTPLQDPTFVYLKTVVSNALQKSWCSNDKVQLLMDLIMLERPEICVEIGACTGSSVLPVAVMLNHLNIGKIYAIDAWSNEIATQNMADNDPNKPWWSTVDMATMKASCESLLDSWKLMDTVEIIPLSSKEAASQFTTIDFLHLDGDYTEKGSLSDIELYLPKVKSGGHILLSNLFIMINGKQPKLKAFCTLLKACDLIASIENDNAILFKKR